MEAVLAVWSSLLLADTHYGRLLWGLVVAGQYALCHCMCIIQHWDFNHNVQLLNEVNLRLCNSIAVLLATVLLKCLSWLVCTVLLKHVTVKTACLLLEYTYPKICLQYSCTWWVYDVEEYHSHRCKGSLAIIDTSSPHSKKRKSSTPLQQLISLL